MCENIAILFNFGHAMISIQRFGPEYSHQVEDLIIPIQREEFQIPITYEQQPDLQDIPGFYQKNAGEFWLALHDTHVVGSIALLDIGNCEAALRKMFVAVKYRGKPYNVAQKLLGTLLDHAALSGLRHIYLGTTNKFIAAHCFYEKNGFSRIDPAALPPAFPRMAVDTVFYSLILDPI